METKSASKMKQAQLTFHTLAASPARASRKRKLGLEDLEGSPCKSSRKSEASCDVKDDGQEKKENVEASGSKQSSESCLEIDEIVKNEKTAVDKGDVDSGDAKTETEGIITVSSEEEEAQETEASHKCVTDSTPSASAKDGDAVANVSTDTATSEDLDSSVVSTSAADESGLGSSQLSASTPKTPRRAVTASAKSRKALRGEVAKRKEEEKEKRRAEKEAEKEKKKQLREQKRREKEQQLEERKREKERKQKEMEERKRDIEEKKREREQRRLELQQEQENLKMQKVERQAARLEEMKRREEDKKQKLEEKKRAEEEAEKEKQKLKAAFESFFVKKAKTSTRESTENLSDVGQGMFRPFEPKQGMTLAPVVPPVALERFNKEALQQQMEKQNTPVSEQYLASLQTGKACPFRTSSKSKKLEKKEDDDVIVVDTESSRPKERLRAKLLQFCENVRPPYWGTWRKPWETIGGKRPFARHTMLDYEVDSDEEWEEEEPGESLSGTEDEKESEDDYEVDNEFFVPHGYLSEDEEKDGDDPVSPESMKARLKARQEEFQADMKRSCRTLQPLVVGCTWQDVPTALSSASADPLSQFAAVFLVASIPIAPSWETETKTPASPSSSKSKKAKAIPQEAMPHLIKMLHGNTSNRMAILQRFTTFWENQAVSPSADTSSSPGVKSGDARISKRQFIHTVRSIARYSGNCWVVNQETLDRYELGDLELPQKATKQIPEEPRQDEQKEPAKAPLGALHKFLASSPSVKRSQEEQESKEHKQVKKPATGAISKFLTALPSAKAESPLNARTAHQKANATVEAKNSRKEVGTPSDPIVLDDSSHSEFRPALENPPNSAEGTPRAEETPKAKNSLEKYFARVSSTKVLQDSQVVEPENGPQEKPEEIVCI